MKKIEIVLALIAIMLMIGGIANAQTAGDSSAVNNPESYQKTQEQIAEDGTGNVAADSAAVNIPESYQKTQEQLTEDVSVGSATYNIDENKPVVESGAAEWRSDGDVEELRVYSGQQSGNNYVKTIQVKVPVRNSDSYNYRPE